MPKSDAKLGSLNLRREEPLYLQVRNLVLGKIESGELSAGSKLPPSAELAKQLGASACTIQAALSSLVKDGVLKRRQRSGTCVTGSKMALSCVCLLYGKDFWTLPETEYYMRLHAAIERRLAQDRAQCRILTTPLSSKDGSATLAELRALARSRRVQGIIAPLLSGGIEIEDVKGVGLPLAVHTMSDVPQGVSTDMTQMLRLAAKALKSYGCRSAGVISQFGVKMKWFYEGFAKALADEGIELRDEWIMHNDRNCSGMALYGELQFQRLWSLPERPDGLFVYHDVNARGAINAVSRLGVRVPQDLKLLVHHNVGVPFNQGFPLPTTALDPDDVADALFRQLKSQFEGKEPQRLFVPYKLLELPPASIALP